jgi:hypothetical protein
MPDQIADLAHLFSCLVQVLAEGDPSAPRGTFHVSELYQTILPYRQHRSALGFDSHQDYEMALLRLLAGEGGYASVEPAEVQEALAARAAESNPDPGAFREYAGATVRLRASAIDQVLTAELAYAPPTPPEIADEPEPAVPPSSPPVFDLEDAPYEPTEPITPQGPPATGFSDPPPPSTRASTAGRAVCASCGRGLPLHRHITYCPFCGRMAHTPTCTVCGVELEPGWSFCVECGGPLNPSRPRGA